MNISNFVRNMAFNISDEVSKTDEYKTLNKKIIELQEELRKELSESDAFIIDYACNQAFLHGIATGQAVEVNKASKGGYEV